MLCPIQPIANSRIAAAIDTKMSLNPVRRRNCSSSGMTVVRWLSTNDRSEFAASTVIAPDATASSNSCWLYISASPVGSRIIHVYYSVNTVKQPLGYACALRTAGGYGDASRELSHERISHRSKEMAKKATGKRGNAKSASAKSGGRPGSSKSQAVVERRSGDHGRRSADAGVGDAFIKLLQSPLVAELVAVAATAALAALAQEGFGSGGAGGKRGGQTGKQDGKAGAKTGGQRPENQNDQNNKKDHAREDLGRA